MYDQTTARTAIKRSKPSTFAVGLARDWRLHQAYPNTLLDFGCGFGRDVAYYRSHGIDAVGFDPGARFKDVAHRVDTLGQYDVVTCTYVLNTLELNGNRNVVLEQAASAVKPGGSLYICARSRRDVEACAWRGNWEPVGLAECGWRTGSGTYQRGYSELLLQYVLRARLQENGLPWGVTEAYPTLNSSSVAVRWQRPERKVA